MKPITDVLGKGLSSLLGMPGAFTPTCNDKHLPGYYNSASAFAGLGVDSINCLTINDKWVNVAWQAQVAACALGEEGASEPTEDPIQMIADPRGDLLEKIGMIGYLGRELGVRSKRFALLVEDGVVCHVAVDEGSIALRNTSAEALLALDFFAERRVRMAAAAEAFVAGELSLMTSAVDAEAYLSDDATRQKLLAAFVDETTITQSLAVVTKAAEAERTRAFAEAAVAAELWTKSAPEAYKYLCSSAVLGRLRTAGVSPKVVDASLAAMYEAALAVDPNLKPPPKAATAGASDGEAPSVGVLAVLAGVVLAGGVYVLTQQPDLVPSVATSVAS